MGRKDPRVDASVARSTEFAQPILERLRQLVRASCPARIERGRRRNRMYARR